MFLEILPHLCVRVFESTQTRFHVGPILLSLAPGIDSYTLRTLKPNPMPPRHIRQQPPLDGISDDERPDWVEEPPDQDHLPEGEAAVGLGDDEEDGDQGLIRDLLVMLYEQKADYTLAFRRLADAAEGGAADDALGALLEDGDALAPWLALWRARLSRGALSPQARAAAMRKVNPAFIPRNHKVEEALTAAVDHGDLSLFEALNDVLARPYEDRPAFAAYAAPPQPGEEITATFCGT